MVKEIWKGVRGYEGYYEISNYGRARSLDRILKRRDHNVRAKGCIIKGFNDGGGYLKVMLYRNSKYKLFSRHRLVAEAFLENPNNHKVVNHIDHNKTNNKITNLEWCTQSHNLKEYHKYIDYENKNNKKVIQFDKSMNIINTFKSIRYAARETGIIHGNISRCCHKRKHHLTAGGYKWRFADERKCVSTGD